MDLDDVFGYLTCKPFNSGSAFEMRVLYENEKEKENLEVISKVADKMDLASTKILTTGVEVYNRNKVNMSQADILKKFSDFTAAI